MELFSCLSTQFSLFVFVLFCHHAAISFSIFQSSPFHFICHGNAKKKSQRNICRSILFCAFSVEGQGHFSFLCAAQVLKVMKTIFHLQGVIWPGVAEQVCYGKINIMEGLTLLSLSHWDQCVFYWTGYIKQTSRPLLDKHTSVQACNTIHKCSWTHTYLCVCVYIFKYPAYLLHG